MHIKHTAMYVNNLEAVKEFFVIYFGGVPSALYHNQQTGFRSYFLRFDDGPSLEIMSRPLVSDAPKSFMRTGFIHIAFGTGSREGVDRLTERLQNDGYKVLSGPRMTGDGYYESCILGPEDNQIEITE